MKAPRPQHPRKRSDRPSAAVVRVLSKRGICSRAEAFELVRAGRVFMNGVAVRDPATPVPASARLEVDGRSAGGDEPIHLMLNKPRGLVTTSADEHGRDTVFSCLAGAGLPRVIAVGRLDKASEGLLLLTNDTQWAAHVTDPISHVHKTYHVQINAIADDALLARLSAGVDSNGEHLAATKVRLLRAGEKNSWIEVVLDEGRNRHIRRMFDALGISVLRLVRVAIGALSLGELPKGKWRKLTDAEIRMLARTR